MSGQYVSYEQIETQGITDITQEDFAYARSFGMAIKLLGMIRKNENGFFTIVAPFLIPLEHPLASVNEVFNAIVVHGNMLGNTMYYGKGAGKEATASAVVGDLIDCVIHAGTHIAVNMNTEPAKLSDNGSFVHRFFVRVPKEMEEEAAEAFGDEIEIITSEKINGEFAFVTDLISEKHFHEAYGKITKTKGYLRLL